jgi:hypothetical protein
MTKGNILSSTPILQGASNSIVMFVMYSYFNKFMNKTLNRAESPDKLLITYEGTKGAVFPPYFSHVELYFNSINYMKVVLLDSMTKQPIMKCIYTRGFFALAGGGSFQIILEQSLNEGFKKLEEIKKAGKRIHRKNTLMKSLLQSIKRLPLPAPRSKITPTLLHKILLCF